MVTQNELGVYKSINCSEFNTPVDRINRNVKSSINIDNTGGSVKYQQQLIGEKESCIATYPSTNKLCLDIFPPDNSNYAGVSWVYETQNNGTDEMKEKLIAHINNHDYTTARNIT